MATFPLITHWLRLTEHERTLLVGLYARILGPIDLDRLFGLRERWHGAASASWDDLPPVMRRREFVRYLIATHRLGEGAG